MKLDSAKQLYFINSRDQNAVFPQLGKYIKNVPLVQEQVGDGYIRLATPFGSPYVALVSPFEEPEESGVKRFDRLILPDRRNIMMLINPAEEKTVDETAIMSAFGLTHAQAKVAVCLFRGMSLKATAQHNRIAYSTAKSHLKSATSIMGVHSQTELVLRLAGILCFS